MSIVAEETARTGKTWLALARGAWGALAIVLLALYGVGLVQRMATPISLCIAPPCTEGEAVVALSRIGVSPALFRAYTITLRDIVVPLVYVSMSFLLFRYRRESWLALGVAALLLSYALTVNTDLLSSDALIAPLAPLIALLQVVTPRLFVLALIYVLLTFPTGRFVPAWSTWLLLPFFAVAALAPALGVLNEEAGVLVVLVLLALFQLYRYARRSTPHERQQAKWGLLGLLGLCLNGVLWLALIVPMLEEGAASLPRYMAFLPISTLLVGALPVGLGIAIFRYKLWNIDIIIRRTLVYALLSGALALVFFGSVVLLQRLLTPLLGNESPVAVVASTLAIAALFTPLRRRIQRFIDRRFFRQKYDAQRILADFALTARDETDLDALTVELTRVVQESVQPQHVSVWLRAADRLE